MAGRWVLLAAGLSASGCVVAVGDRPPPAPVVPDAAPVREFASMRPGDFKPDHPALAATLTAKPAEPPIPPPPIQPPTTPVSALVPPDSPLVAAVRSLEADQPTASDLPPGVLPALTAGVQLYRARGPAAAGEAVRQLDATAAALAPLAPLELAKAVFCRDVRGFGLYDPLPTERPAYPAGKKPTVMLYLELRNVAPQVTEGQYAWRPRVTWVVRDGSGAVIDQRAEVLPREPVRSLSRENFVKLWFAAPERPGSYTVSVSVAEPAADGRGVSREVSKQLGFVVK